MPYSCSGEPGKKKMLNRAKQENMARVRKSPMRMAGNEEIIKNSSNSFFKFFPERPLIKTDLNGENHPLNLQTPDQGKFIFKFFTLFHAACKLQNDHAYPAAHLF